MPDQDMDALFAGSQQVGNDAALSRVNQLMAEEYDLLQEKRTGEAMVAASKERLNEIYHDRLPEAMLAAGVTEFKLPDGTKASLSFAADGALGSPQTEEEHREKERKLDLIEEHGGGEIIKFTVEVQFPKELAKHARALVKRIDEWCKGHGLKGIGISIQRTIHHQTLKKWIKDRMEDGAELPLNDLGIWYGQIGKITGRPKNNG